MTSIEEALTALKQYFGFEEFRAGQREVIESVLAGNDTVVVMPTGGGKSLCYQLPAMIAKGTTLVVSPLIALMKDQVDALHARQLPATFINSSLNAQQTSERLAGIRDGSYKLVYVAPERFRSDRFLEALGEINVSIFAVDEAHCVSHWGHDFRPDYLRLKAAAQAAGRPPILALTATATPHVRSDIAEQLGMRKPHSFVSGFDRSNLRINVIETPTEHAKITQIKQLAKSYGNGSGIIYTSTRKAVTHVAESLKDAGLKAVSYHAGMDEDARSRAQDAFMSGQVQVIVATNAFGMGIDKSDIRFVVHFQMPGSIEAYYQEIGRAGRDGLDSDCVLLFNYADKQTQDFFIEGSFPTPEIISDVYQALVSTGLRRIELSSAEIAIRAGVRNEMSVNSALALLERAGHIDRGSAMDNRAEIRLLLPPPVARTSVGDRDSHPRRVLFILLSEFNLIQQMTVDINVLDLAQRLGIEIQAVKRAFSSLSASGILSYTPARRTRATLMLDETPVKQLRIKPAEIAKRAAFEQRKLREMINFCYTDQCYRAFILNYFGDVNHLPRCQSCGNCVVTRHSGRMAATPRNGPASKLDAFTAKSRPYGRALDQELAENSRRKRDSRESENRGRIANNRSRALNEDEQVEVRKILACATRMRGRFGKILLASTLRGSRAKGVLQAGLDRLSTYGILSNLSREALLTYIEALIEAQALTVSTGEYPTISITPLGTEVMHQRLFITLAIPKQTVSDSTESNPESRKPGPRKPLPPTARVSYSLYTQGLSIELIATRRNLSPVTIEDHLTECIRSGMNVELDKYISPSDRVLIDSTIAKLGAGRIKPLREALPERITYRMIKFAAAAVDADSRKV